MSRERLILAIDQGTTNTKALLIGRSGEVLARASRKLPISFPRPGWVEQDANALWASVQEVISECVSQVKDAEIAAIGISNQRESTVVWNRANGEPAGPCITWQCRRTAERCRELTAGGFNPTLRELTGLAIDPLFSASKIAWLLANIDDGEARARAGSVLAGTVDSWLLWKLTNGAVHATDASNASRTQLMNLANAAWNPALAGIFGVPLECLPEIRASSGVFGTTVKSEGVPAGIPIAAMIGDSHAALFGHRAFKRGAVKATYGTGSSLMTLTNGPVASQNRLSSTVAWSIGGTVSYALEGNITNTGATVEWTAGLLGLEDAHEVAALAATTENSGGVYLVPAFSGLGAPHWDADARGIISGLTRGTDRGQIARAALESIAYQINDVFEAMRNDAGIPLPALLADGSPSGNDVLMQFQSDIANCDVISDAATDLSALGAAWLAGLAVGQWRSTDDLPKPTPQKRFTPSMPESKRNQLLAGWREAVLKCRAGATTQNVSGRVA